MVYSMLQDYRNLLLKVIAWIYVANAVQEVVLHFVGNPRFGYARIIEFLLIAIALFLTTRSQARTNLSSWIFTIYYVVSNAAYLDSDIAATGHVTLNIHLFFPIFVFFLIGLRWGTVLLSVHMGILLIALQLYDGNTAIFGSNGLYYVQGLVYIAILSFFIEWTRQRIIIRSERIGGTDSLTGLYNRSGFMVRAANAMLGDYRFYLVLLDLDHFGRLNFILGNQFGDQILKAVADKMRINPRIREPARHYGDSFAFLFYGSSEELRHEITWLQQELGLLPARFGTEIPLEASFGCALANVDSRRINELWTFAEASLQKAKRMGGPMRLTFFQEELIAHERQRSLLAESLRTAIRSGNGIETHFQPKICLRSGKVCSIEALARWPYSEYGPIPPGVFIPLAEQNGLIYDLGWIIIKQSIAFLAKLHAQVDNSVSIAINVSAVQMLNPAFATAFHALCQENHVPSDKLWLEITESLLVQPEAKETMEALRCYGYRFSLDDFGTGYSSLSYLSRFHFDELKVDKSFTDKIIGSSSDQHVFRTIIAMAQGLGMQTTVEGVESAEQLDLIRDMSVDHVQGWYYAKALPGPECLAYIAQWNASVDPNGQHTGQH